MDETEAEEFFENLEVPLKESFKIPKKITPSEGDESRPPEKRSLPAVESSPLSVPEEQRMKKMKFQTEPAGAGATIPPRKTAAPSDDYLTEGRPPRKTASDYFTDVERSNCGGAAPTPVPAPASASASGAREFEIWKELYDSKLPDELESKCGMIRCELCSLYFKSPIEAKVHYLGKPHERKVTKFLEEWASRTGQRAPKRVENIDKTPSLSVFDDPSFCKVCNLSLSSKIVAMSHYQGKNHAKQLKKKMKEEESAPAVVVVEPLVKNFFTENSVSDKLSEIRKEATSKFCSPCNFTCESEAEFEDHSKSPEHQRKISSSSQSTSSVIDSEIVDGLDCNICKVSCNSQYALETHLAGKIHKSKLKLQSENLALNKDLFCEICNVTTTSPSGLQDHLRGKKHKKKLAALAQSI